MRTSCRPTSPELTTAWKLEPAKPSVAEPDQVVVGILARIRQHNDFAPAGGNPGQSVDGARIGRDPIMQHPVLVDEVEIELIRDVAQSVDAFHDDSRRSKRAQASRATPTAASSLSDITTGTPRVVARMRRQLSFAAPPPTVATPVRQRAAEFGQAPVTQRFDACDAFEQPLQKHRIVVRARRHPRLQGRIVDGKALTAGGKRIIIEAGA